jgi:arylsulfatase
MRRLLLYVLAATTLTACSGRSSDHGARDGDEPKRDLVKAANAAAPAKVQTTGTAGAPNATTTANPAALPNPPPKFGGVANMTASGSKSWWPPRIVPPKGAPNVLLIMTDDAGYGVSGTFGGVIPTPAMDRVAKMGLRYTHFHSTALCSPTRAALITGRNHHAVGFGVISEQATGFPGYDSIIGVDNGTVGRILSENGYATSWFGKNHNTPDFQYSQAGPFDQWPTGMGFDYFYGFMGGETDQYRPFLFRNTTPIAPWKEQPNFNLVTGMADDAIRHMRELNAAAPDQPFFVYYVPGATHAPHQPTKEWVGKFKGKFDMGWNKMREQIFANQKKLGVIPQNTELTAWPDGQPEFGGAKLPTWDSLTPVQKKLFARQAEVFAAYVAYNDHEIGRVIQAVDDLGKLDDTLVIYITGDNGTSAEGSVEGTPFDLAAIQGINIPVAKQMLFYNQWGDPKTQPHMSVAWSWAFDTPFKWTKQIASHFGGTRQGMAIAWPKRIKDAGGIRHQFHHVIDIVPTILQAAGITAPTEIDGVVQKPIEGVSMMYTFDANNANTASARKTQYFEMFANRAIYHEGWIATTTPPAGPWLLGRDKLPAVDDYKWELYNLADDFSQARDLATRMPGKLKELQALFLDEAKKNQVFPIDNQVLPRIVAPKPSNTAGRTSFVYPGPVTGTPTSDAPSTLTRSYKIQATVEVPARGANGMIVTDGGRFGGYALYLKQGKPVFTYNFLALQITKWEGSAALAPGKHTIGFELTYDGPGFGKGGSGVLTVDGTEVARNKLAHSAPFLLNLGETFDIGADTRSGVDDRDYQVPFPFTGKIAQVAVELGPRQLPQPDPGRAARTGSTP